MHLPSRSLLVLASLLATARAAYSGFGTAYSGPYNMDGTGANMCGFDPTSLDTRWQIYYGAISRLDWNAAPNSDPCGLCIAVTGDPGVTVVVKIVDQVRAWGRGG